MYGKIKFTKKVRVDLIMNGYEAQLLLDLFANLKITDNNISLNMDLPEHIGTCDDYIRLQSDVKECLEFIP